MTSEDLRSELEKDPFTPLRVHLVSGHSVDVPNSGTAWMLRNALMIFQPPKNSGDPENRYDIIAIRNIERLEQLAG